MYLQVSWPRGQLCRCRVGCCGVGCCCLLLQSSLRDRIPLRGVPSLSVSSALEDWRNCPFIVKVDCTVLELMQIVSYKLDCVTVWSADVFVIWFDSICVSIRFDLMRFIWFNVIDNRWRFFVSFVQRIIAKSIIITTTTTTFTCHSVTHSFFQSSPWPGPIVFALLAQTININNKQLFEQFTNILLYLLLQTPQIHTHFIQLQCHYLVKTPFI